MHQFTEDQPQAQIVPYYEHAREKDGWEGQRTTKKLDRLKADIGETIGRLGGFISLYKSGKYLINGEERPGVQIFYSIGGNPSRIDLAALPCLQKGNRENSLKMALYVANKVFAGMYLLQKLSPGYAALIPFMLVDKHHTMSQLWSENPQLAALLPPPDSDFIAEGTVKE